MSICSPAFSHQLSVRKNLAGSAFFKYKQRMEDNPIAKVFPSAKLHSPIMVLVSILADSRTLRFL
jgi:hypothetical protein